MYEIQTFTGRVQELRRFMNRRPRITEHDPSGERWEMWLTASDGLERKFVVWSRYMPARVGHVVHLLHVDDAPVGLFNVEARVRASFVRADPPRLFRPFDGAVWTGGVFVAMACMLLGKVIAFALVMALVLLYFPSIAVIRFIKRRSLQRQVDDFLVEIHYDHVVRPFRQRQ